MRERMVDLVGWSYQDIADTMNACFEGYVIPVSVGAQAMEWKERGEDMRPELSRVLLIDDQPAAIVLVNRRGNHCRIGALAIAPQHRGKGIGERVMLLAIEEARRRSDAEMVLEVIQQNPPAVALYKKLGFEITGCLPGLQAEGLDGTACPEMEQISVGEAAGMIANRAGEFPWDAGPDSLGRLSDQFEAYRLGGSMLIVRATEGPVLIRGIAHDGTDAGANQTARLVSGVANKLGERAWRLPPIFAESLVEPVLLPLGFEHGPISQYRMRLEL